MGCNHIVLDKPECQICIEDVDGIGAIENLDFGVRCVTTTENSCDTNGDCILLNDNWQILIDLYYATEGANWDISWVITDPIYCDWDGIVCDGVDNIIEM